MTKNKKNELRKDGYIFFPDLMKEVVKDIYKLKKQHSLKAKKFYIAEEYITSYPQKAKTVFKTETIK